MRKIGRYVLLSRIASGTLGDVFLARRDVPGRAPADASPDEPHVAVKVLRPELARDLRFLRLLFAEAQAAVRFEHAAAVRTLEIERDGADVFIAMELERGQPLSSVLKRAQIAGEPLEHRLVCWVAAEIAAVLQRAHETPWFPGAPVGMIHGAISPRGVLVTYEGRVKLLGVGIGRARLALPPSSARLPYHAPELLADREPTPKVDVYSLGVLLHDALSGKHAFRRATDEETKAAIREARIAPLNPLSLRVSPAIGDFIQGMIAPRPEARADLAAVEHVLRGAAAGDDVELSLGLERRMRAIFAGEIRAERRVVQAAQRQPRSLVPSSPPGSVARDPSAPREPSAAEVSPGELRSSAEPGAGSTTSDTLRPPPREGSLFPRRTPSEEVRGPSVLAPRTPSEEVRGPSVVAKRTPSEEVRGPSLSPKRVPTEELPRPALRAPSLEPRSVERRAADALLGAALHDAAATLADTPVRSLAEMVVARAASSVEALAPALPSPTPAVLAGAAHDEPGDTPVDKPASAFETAETLPPNASQPVRAALAAVLRGGSALAVTPQVELSLDGATPSPDLPVPVLDPLLRGGGGEPRASEGPRPSDVPLASLRPRSAVLLASAGSAFAAAARAPAQDDAHSSLDDSTEALSRPPGSDFTDGDPPTERATSVRPDRAETTTMDLALRRRVARYQTQALLSRSAATVVFRARDPNIARDLALKVMDPEFVSDPRLRREEWVALFKKEARVAGRLFHPRLPVLFDAGRDASVYFLAYSLAEGEPLQAVLDRAEVLDAERVRRTLLDLASALDHMHERGVVHSDVRASNVVLGRDGRGYLVDLSMATELGGPEHPLLAANLPALAPEYLAGFGYGARADQFALGTVLYQMLTGVRPFRGADDRELMKAIEELSPRPPEAVDPRVDPELSEIAMRLLEKDPALRFESLGALVRRLEARPAPASDALSERAKTPIFAHLAERDPEGDTQPSLRPIINPRARHSKEVDMVIIDPELDPEVAGQVYTGHGERVAVYPDLDQGMEQIARDRPQAVVLARTATDDVRAARRKLAEVSRDLELRLVPDLASRLVGPVLPTEQLATALAELYQRTTMLAQPIEHPDHAGAVGAARAIATKLGAGPRTELLAPLAVAARELAARLRLSPTSEGISSVVPKEVEIVFAEVEQVLTSPPSEGKREASLLAEIVAVVEQYFALTWPKDGRKRVSPRRAILELREQAKDRVSPDVVEALVEHLRDVISALDLGPADQGAAKVLVAGNTRALEIAQALEGQGFVVVRVGDGHTAWEKLRRDGFAGAIVELDLPGRDGLSLLRLCRAHPDTDQVPFLVLTSVVQPDSARDVASAGAAALVDQGHKLDAIRAHVARWVEAKKSE